MKINRRLRSPLPPAGRWRACSTPNGRPSASATAAPAQRPPRSSLPVSVSGNFQPGSPAGRGGEAAAARAGAARLPSPLGRGESPGKQRRRKGGRLHGEALRDPFPFAAAPGRKGKAGAGGTSRFLRRSSCPGRRPSPCLSRIGKAAAR